MENNKSVGLFQCTKVRKTSHHNDNRHCTVHWFLLNLIWRNKNAYTVIDFAVDRQTSRQADILIDSVQFFFSGASIQAWRILDTQRKWKGGKNERCKEERTEHYLGSNPQHSNNFPSGAQHALHFARIVPKWWHHKNDFSEIIYGFCSNLFRTTYLKRVYTQTNWLLSALNSWDMGVSSSNCFILNSLI